MSSEAFVTLATTDGYALGALVLAQSIRQVGTKRNLVVLISNHLSDLIRRTLETNFDEVILVEELNSNDKEHLELLTRPELGITFTKINSWLLEQYSKCVFLDSDCLVLRPIDDLFEKEELSAASDAGWPDCFNSGVFVFKPSKDTFNKLTLFASEHNASFDGGDQGLLNAFFSNWRSGDISRHLPFTYNVTANAFYSYLPAVTRFRNDIHIVHFAGSFKPWHLTYNPQNQQLSGNLSGQNDIQREFILKWWTVMHERVWSQISQLQQNNSNTNSADGQSHSFGQLSGPLNYGHLTCDRGIQLGSVAHRRAWEAGHVDYQGRDSFDNIQQLLERNMASHPQINHPSQTTSTVPQKTTTSILKQTVTETKITTTSTSQQQQSTINHSKTLLKESTPLKQSQEEVSHHHQQTVSAETRPTVERIHLTKSALKESLPPLTQTTNLPQTTFKETNLPQTTSKETKLSQSSTLLSDQTQSLVGSTHLTENKNVTSDHESNWTVKSTIVTAYTQGVGVLAGPTVVSKVVSESSASTSNDLPHISTIKHVTGPTTLPETSLTAKTSNEHVAWLFDKFFLGITYVISLCYLVFLVAMRRSNSSSIIHGNGTSIHGVTSSSSSATTTTINGKRVNH